MPKPRSATRLLAAELPNLILISSPVSCSGSRHRHTHGEHGMAYLLQAKTKESKQRHAADVYHPESESEAHWCPDQSSTGTHSIAWISSSMSPVGQSPQGSSVVRHCDRVSISVSGGLLQFIAPAGSGRLCEHFGGSYVHSLLVASAMANDKWIIDIEMTCIESPLCRLAHSSLPHWPDRTI